MATTERYGNGDDYRGRGNVSEGLTRQANFPPTPPQHMGDYP